jgi:hypothetical protein
VICTSTTRRSSTRISSGFNLCKHSSPSFGSQSYDSNSWQTRVERCRVHIAASGLTPWLHMFAFTTAIDFLVFSPCHRIALLGPCFKTGVFVPTHKNTTVEGFKKIKMAHTPPSTLQAEYQKIVTDIPTPKKTTPRFELYLSSLCKDILVIQSNRCKTTTSSSAYCAPDHSGGIVRRIPNTTLEDTNKRVHPKASPLYTSPRRNDTLFREGRAKDLSNLRFQFLLTLFSKSFSTFPHGTCLLSISRQVFSLRWNTPPD